jgi:hypothetical protein
MNLESALRTVSIIAAGTPESPTDQTLIAELNSIKGDSKLWDNLLFVMKVGRITQLFYWQLMRQSLEEHVPDKIRESLEKRYKRAKSNNSDLLGALEQIHQELERRNIRYSAWKGVPLLSHCYPDIGSRPMADIDIAAETEQRNEIVEAFSALGYEENHHLLKSATGYNAISENGLEVDIHFEAKLFKDYPFLEIHQSLEFPPLINCYFAPKPEAMLAHLIWHWEKHTHTWGHILRHFFDLIFFYRGYGKELDVQLVEKYISAPKEKAILLRANALISELAPETKIPKFEFTDRTIQGFSIAESMRSSLIAHSHLSRRQTAWTRLILSWFGIVKARSFLSPSVSNLMAAFFDSKRHQQTIKIVSTKN